MDNIQAEFWQLVWFFSMDAPVQAALVGKTEEPWFIEEDETNAGANYLIGLCIALCDVSRPDHPAAHELCRAVLAICDCKEPGYWRFEFLSETAEWDCARALALKLLDAEKPRVTPPRKSFTIENMIRVEHYLHASELRGKVRMPKKSRKYRE